MLDSIFRLMPKKEAEDEKESRILEASFLIDVKWPVHEYLQMISQKPSLLQS